MAGPDLSRMSEQEAIAALRQYYAQAGQLNPQDPYAGSGIAADPQYSQGVMPSYGNDKLSGFRPDGDGYFGNLTAPFDPMNPGGRYGSYQGRFSADGTLDLAFLRLTVGDGLALAVLRLFDTGELLAAGL